MRDVALITATIEKARQAEVRRLEECPGFDAYQRRIIVREVDASIRNVAHAVMALAEPERPVYFNQ